MEAKNFRIGNFIGIKEQAKKDVFDTCHVDNPEALGEKLFGIASISDDEINLYVGNEQIEFSFNELEQVKITDDNLKRLGFKQSGAELLYLPMPELKSEIHYEKKPYGNVITLQSSVGMFIPNDIDTVDQLQNLFFALTGNELQLKKECSTCG